MSIDLRALREYCRQRGLPHDDESLKKFLQISKKVKEDSIKRAKKNTRNSLMVSDKND
jgi:hypothetical protein